MLNVYVVMKRNYGHDNSTRSNKDWLAKHWDKVTNTTQMEV